MGTDIIDRAGRQLQRIYDKFLAMVQEKKEQAARRIPGSISGPVQLITGACFLAIFGGMSLGIGLAGLLLGSSSSIISAMTISCLAVFLPLAAISAFLLGRGILIKNRVDRLRRYLRICSDRSYIMLEDLSAESGQPMKKTKKDVIYLLDHNLIPDARMDQQETCLLLTPEAISQYESAMESKRIREEEARKKQRELEELDQLVDEENEMYDFLRQSEDNLTLLDEYSSRIYSPTVKEKLRHMSLVLGQIFTCVREHPEKVRLTRRLMHYYIPSVMKMLETYDDLEKQPIQGENIQHTRMEIESSLDNINKAFENMFDELFQEEALDISSDIQVLNTILERDGWKKGQMKAEERRPTGFGD